MRVGDAPNITLGHKGIWKINDQGGMPTAWVENNGNDVAVLQLSVSGLPDGWTIQGPSQMVVAPNQLLGIPLSLIPSEGWTGQRFLASLEVTHPSLGLQIHDIEIEKGILAFATSPVYRAASGTQVSILMNSEVSNDDFTSNEQFSLSDNSISIIMGTDKNEVILISTTNSSETLSLYLAGYELPNVEVECSLDSSAFSQLGILPLNGYVGECSVTASGEPVRATLVLLSNTGERISLVENTIHLGANENSSYEVNVSEWSPQAGMIEVQVMVIDSYGRILDSQSVSTVSRSSGWNLAIFSFSANDGELQISIQRSEYERLADVICRIEIESIDSEWSTTRIVDVVDSDYAPVVIIRETQGLPDNDRLEATLSCDSPYDIDDNLEDNKASAYFSMKNEPIVEQSDVLISIGIASILLIIAFFAGVFTQNAPQKVEKKQSKSKPLPQIKTDETESVEEIEDEFSFVFEDEDTSVEGFETPLEEVVVEEEAIELDDELDVSASGRLASLGKEIGNDKGKNQTIEDRMNRLFGDK